MPLFIALLPNRTVAQLATGIAVEGVSKRRLTDRFAAAAPARYE